MTKLFDENLGIANNEKQLKNLKKKYSQYDPYYVAQSTIYDRSHIRLWLESLWKQYESFADTNFRSEFQKHFNQRAWELYLGSTFINRGHAIIPHTGTSPDFKIPFNKNHLWIEAIATEKGIGQDKVPEIEYGKAMDVPENEMLLRLMSGLIEKHNKYVGYIQKGVIENKDPYVIAIDRSPLEFLDAQIPLILKCLFSIGHQVLFLKTDNKKIRQKGTSWSLRDKLIKVSGNEVGMNLFQDSQYEGISAVIYSAWNILNSPREADKMGDNLVIVHNPLAKNPLPDKYFHFGDVWKQSGDQMIKI